MNLQYLQHLNLSQNQLSKLQLSNLPSLAYLNVAGTVCRVYIEMGIILNKCTFL